MLKYFAFFRKYALSYGMQEYVLLGKILIYVLNIRDYTGSCAAHISRGLGATAQLYSSTGRKVRATLEVYSQPSFSPYMNQVSGAESIKC